jgi:hypothetical protein
MTELDMSLLEDLDVDDLLSLPKGFQLWYAEHGIPEYWIVEETPDGADDDGVVTIMRLDTTGDEPDYVEERSLPVSQLEVEYRA